MTRLTVVLAVWIGLNSVAAASLSPRPERLPRRELVPRTVAARLSTPVPDVATSRTTGSDYTVTDQTQILLDGKPCRYQDVPEKAVIQRMEVAPDGKTVLRIIFRSPK